MHTAKISKARSDENLLLDPRRSACLQGILSTHSSSETLTTDSTSTIKKVSSLKYQSSSDTLQADEEPFQRRRQVTFTESTSSLLFHPERALQRRTHIEKESSISSCPFADGIVAGSEREAATDAVARLPGHFSLKLDWPLTYNGINVDQATIKEGSKGDIRLMNSASLLFYRLKECVEEEKESQSSSISLSASQHQDADRVIYRSYCKKPSWTTPTKRYESPIQVGLGMEGPIIWEAHPKAGGEDGEKISSWTLLDCETRKKTPVLVEFMGDVIFTCPANYTWRVTIGHKMNMVIKMTSVERIGSGIKVPVAYWGYGGQYEEVEIDTRPEATQYQSVLNQPIDAGFVLIMFEVTNAIQDELARKNRRDSRGRFIQPKKGLLGKALSKLL